MLAVPAAIAGCPQRILCTPARRGGHADPGVLTAAQLCGIDTVYKVGGAQAIAAMAYGTATIPKVARIYGPGNRWVTAAKQLVAADADGAAIDLPAGPSEVCIIAETGADADHVAADLLAQAEHDSLAQAILICTDAALALRVAERVRARLPSLSRQDILAVSLAHVRLIVVPDLPTAAAIAEQNRWLAELLDSPAGSTCLDCTGSIDAGSAAGPAARLAVPPAPGRRRARPFAPAPHRSTSPASNCRAAVLPAGAPLPTRRGSNRGIMRS
jgi:histidinol dehydrogenase